MNEFDTTINQLVNIPIKNDAFSIAFFVLAILLASVWHNFMIVFVHKTREMMLSHDWRTFEAENANSGSRFRFILIIITLSSVSIFFYQVNAYMGGRNLQFWYILLIITALHLVRILMTKFIEIVFSLSGVYEIWFEGYSWTHYILGVLFFPLAVLMTYSPETTFSICGNLALALFLLSEIVLIYRIFSVFYNGIVSLFYLFLYLCALEILPLLIVYRLLS